MKDSFERKKGRSNAKKNVDLAEIAADRQPELTTE